MRVIAASRVSGRQDASERELKSALAQRLAHPPRRLDRLSLQALLAAAPLRGRVQADCGLYLAADYPARSNMFALLDSVCLQQRLPKPFEFVNSVSNAAGFHVAQQLGLDGPNLFIGAGQQVWRHLLELAELDLAGGRVSQALLLLCREDGGAFHAEALLLDSNGAAPEGGDFAGLSAGLAVEQLTLD
ncbi:hypothetical protein [Geopseudomonas guangdongensis]|uniref:Beta-ketoacyl synthase, N-terminal domain n=1 Tax=Geopseudomonas guangdongensis TaxID=1245526 RepID=A0A1H2G7L4_9GAMM|nr:hypothetical protein [Pseudomonas guangdongensis]SDU15593.1 hypothetical protein SAMN05216580_1636 [Pseudomonas guangdongensis]